MYNIASIRRAYVVLSGKGAEQAVWSQVPIGDVERHFFADGQSCLRQLKRRLCDVLAVDVELEDMHALTVVREALRIAPCVPVILLTSRSDIRTAVLALKAGAYGVLEKPLNGEQVADAVCKAMSLYAEPVSTSMQPLTPTESRVLSLVLKAGYNPAIAKQMARSVRTIEFHRSQILKKLNMPNMASLIARLTTIRKCLW